MGNRQTAEAAPTVVVNEEKTPNRLPGFESANHISSMPPDCMFGHQWAKAEILANRTKVRIGRLGDLEPLVCHKPILEK
jgi:hypothetical protein